MKLASSFSKAAIFALSMLLLLSCEKKDNESIQKVIEGVLLDVTHADLIPGETISLKPSLLPFNETIQEAISADSTIKDMIFWRSDNSKVAVVDENGLVTAQGVGSCHISFICGTFVAKCRVNVCMFKKEVLYGLWNIDNTQDTYFFGFDENGYENDERFFGWSFDGMRLSVTYKNSPVGQIDKKLVITSVHASYINFYYSDDKDRQSVKMKRIPKEFTTEYLQPGVVQKTGLGDSLINVVDMGLPSGTMWAYTNLGAATPDQDGQRFAWAETTAKDSYSLENYIYYDKNSLELTKYVDDQITEMLPEDDPASVIFGEDWKTPSKVQVNELFDNCHVLYSVVSGKEGFVFVPKNEDYSDRRLFMPFSLTSETLKNNNYSQNIPYSKYGFFWTSTMSAVDAFEAYSLCINMDESSTYLYKGTGTTRRVYGLCVRPVYKSKN